MRDSPFTRLKGQKVPRMVAAIGDDDDDSDEKLPAKETMMDVSQTQLMPQMNDNSGDESENPRMKNWRHLKC